MHPIMLDKCIIVHALLRYRAKGVWKWRSKQHRFNPLSNHDWHVMRHDLKQYVKALELSVVLRSNANVVDAPGDVVLGDLFLFVCLLGSLPRPGQLCYVAPQGPGVCASQ